MLKLLTYLSTLHRDIDVYIENRNLKLLLNQKLFVACVGSPKKKKQKMSQKLFRSIEENLTHAKHDFQKILASNIDKVQCNLV